MKFAKCLLKNVFGACFRANYFDKAVVSSPRASVSNKGVHVNPDCQRVLSGLDGHGLLDRENRCRATRSGIDERCGRACSKHIIIVSKYTDREIVNTM